jgi:predicted alpha/beta hydrolase family esterase
MTHYYTIPGLGNSGPKHWQTYFENSSPDFTRIQQTEWDSPVCNNWIETIDDALNDIDLSNTILIGHSLGCSTIAHWAARYNRIIKGAMLVAPSDVENLVYTFPVTGFAPVPLQKINFPTIIVASSNDKWISLERAQHFAHHWGSELINIDDAGHINADAGFGEWNEGLEILKKFNRRCGERSSLSPV